MDGRPQACQRRKMLGHAVAHMPLEAVARVRQTESLPFVHDSLESQQANYTQVGGSLALPEGQAAANADLELVDDDGNVVAKTVSTKAGSFRFKNVEAGKQYKVRVNKKGFDVALPAQAIQAEKGKEAVMDMSLKKK